MMGVEEEDWTEMVRVLRETEQSIAALSDGDFVKETERSRKCLLRFHSTAGMLGLTDLEKAGMMLEKFLLTQVDSSTSMDLLSAFGFAVSILADQVKDIGDGKGSGAVDMSEIIDILGPEADEIIAGLNSESKPADVQPAVKQTSEPKPAVVQPPKQTTEPKPAVVQPVVAQTAEPKPAVVQPPKQTTEPRPAVVQPAAAQTTVPKPAVVQPVVAQTAEPKPATADTKAAGVAEALGHSRFAEVIRTLGGELSISPNGKGDQFTVTFSGSAESLHELDALLADNKTSPEVGLPFDNKLEKIISRGKEFMAAFSSGNFSRAQEVLQSLADQQQTAGLYKEIGSLARGLHDSIRSFVNTMDPSLMDIVQDKIPDSGNRLEHMLHLMEKSAITTLDHVDAMQERLDIEGKHLSKLRELLGELRPIGNNAVNKISESSAVIDGLEQVISGHQEDLNIILTAQDYQDLSGQIIQKITVLLKDLELKLVNMIRTFGVKAEAGKKTEESDLYGPAHEARTDSVHSQDEVDSLLAEFGF